MAAKETNGQTDDTLSFLLVPPKRKSAVAKFTTAESPMSYAAHLQYVVWCNLVYRWLCQSIWRQL